ncbi:MAG: DUF2218 domain-containing protein [Anaerolineae bacterium]|nr:DUF2218 domain-containing protein [Anaerolineae bacterium]
MLSAQTRVETEKAGRYLKALCNHFSRKVTAAYDDQRGTVDFGFAHCEMRVEGQALVIHVQAAAPDLFERVKFVVQDHLERFAAAEGLRVLWIEPGQQTVQASAETRYCNALALALGLDPAGYAGIFDTLFLLEMPLPWARAILLESEKLPWELLQLVQMVLALPEDERPSIQPLFIAPDEAYSRPGYRRCIAFTRPAGLVAAYHRQEYLVPEAEVGPLIWALQQAPDTLGQFDAYRVQAEGVRDLLVCTHGSRDVACAKFGYPLYRALRDELASDAVRVWRGSHFGGHVFAPTLLDMPRGDYWAFVGPEQAQQIVGRTGDVGRLRQHFRGCAALPYGFAQALEREIWMQVGWRWHTYARQGRVTAIAEGPTPTWAEVQMDYQAPDGTTRGTYRGRVAIKQHVETIASTGDTQPHVYPQYVVTHLEEIE